MRCPRSLPVFSVVFGLVLFSQVSVAFADSQITKNLQRGDKSEEVKILQGVLAKVPNIYPNGLISGAFGPATESAVRKFQKMFGIDQTGVVGPKTRAKINEIIKNLSIPAAPNPSPLPAPSPVNPPPPPATAITYTRPYTATSSWVNIKIDSAGISPTIAWNGHNYGVAWLDKDSILFARFNEKGKKIGDTTKVISGLKKSSEMRLISGTPINGTTTGLYALSWIGDIGFGPVLYLAQLDLSGEKIGQSPIVSPSDYTLITTRPAFVWNGRYTTSWIVRNSGIYFSRITQPRADPASFAIDSRLVIPSSTVTDDPRGIDMAWNGSVFGTVWLDVKDSGDPKRPSLYFATVDGKNSLIVQPIKISGKGLVAGSPSILADGVNFAVVWQESGADGVNTNSGSYLFFTKISRDGVVLVSPKRITMVPFSLYGGYNVKPWLAKDGTAYAVSWTFKTELASPPRSFRQGPGGIYLKFIDSNGNLIKADELISAVSGDNDFSYIAGNSGGFLISWTRRESDADSVWLAYRSTATTTKAVYTNSMPFGLATVLESIKSFFDFLQALLQKFLK